MPAFPPADDGFLALWPTLLCRRDIPQCEAANQRLAELVLERERQRPAMTSDYAADNLFDEDDPAMDWLRRCVNKTVTDYLRREGIDYDIHWQLQGWANVNREGDYHNLHNHPHSYLSGTYYVKVPDAYPARAGRQDLNPGDISFFDPRGQANQQAIRGDGQVNPEFRVSPKAGLILLWPSFLLHLVHPNLSRQPRISISFNVLLRWSNDYLPRQ